MCRRHRHVQSSAGLLLSGLPISEETHAGSCRERLLSVGPRKTLPKEWALEGVTSQGPTSPGVLGDLGTWLLL